ncbi:hypothetical protein F4859DRAFT_490181 [Xylaria cf. heliscus]|nr:hypothetical protein F4859DRAFT_490181 [Xylaria cf. heliscus]
MRWLRPMAMSEFKANFPHGDLNALRPVPDMAAVRDAARKMHVQGDTYRVCRFHRKYIHLKTMFKAHDVEMVGSGVARRFCLYRNFVKEPLPKHTILIYTDADTVSGILGAVFGGCAFRFDDVKTNVVRFRLEDRGPDGLFHPECLPRAAFRAIIAALEFKVSTLEAFISLLDMFREHDILQAYLDVDRTTVNSNY